MSTTATEWAVAYGLSSDPGATAEDAAGREVFDDEAEAREDVQWRVESGLFRRTVTYGPWERVPVEKHEPGPLDDGVRYCKCCHYVWPCKDAEVAA